MNNYKIIVLMLGHRSLSGKDTIAGFLKEYGWKRIAFADKLKSTVADLYNFSHEQMHGELKDVEDLRYPNTFDPETITIYDEDDYGPIPFPGYDHEISNPDYKPLLTPRRVLQVFGQDQRKLFPNIWAQYVFDQIDREVNEKASKIHTMQLDLSLSEQLYVITDFRFKNEFVVAKRWEEKSSNRIVIPVKIERDIESKAGKNDISEHDLDDFNKWEITVDNNDSLSRLCRDAKVLNNAVLSKYGYK